MATVTYAFRNLTGNLSLMTEENSFPADAHQRGVSLAGLAGGRWTSSYDEAGTTIGAQGRTASGAYSYNTNPLNTITSGNQFDSDVGALNNGNSITVWTDESGGPGAGVIRGRIVSPTGTALNAVDLSISGGVFGGNQINADVAGLATASSGFVATWIDSGGAGNNIVRLSVFTSAGVAVTGAVQVATGAENSDPHVVGLTNGFGDFVVTWSQKSGAFNDMYFRRYDSSGAPLAAAQLIDNTGNINVAPQITALGGGGFAIVYVDSEYGGGTGNDITMQIFNSTGGFVSKQRVNVGATAGDQGAPAITRLANGMFIVGWQNDDAVSTSRSVDTALFSSAGVFLGNPAGVDFGGSDQIALAGLVNREDPLFVVGRTFRRPGDPELDDAYGVIRVVETTTVGDATSETLIGDATWDIIVARAGNDTVNGAAGNDLVLGEGGDDSIRGGNGNDSVYGGDNNDLILGQSDNDYLDGQGENDSVYGGDNNDTVVGNIGNDYLDGQGESDEIYGNDGLDTLVGNIGTDYLDGGDGRDELYGNDQNDTLFGNLGGDYLDGQGENDEIYGGSGNDTVIGNIGNDQLWGGIGTDSLIGGLGDDQFRFALGDLQVGVRDVIADFAEAGGNADLLVFFGVAGGAVTTAASGGGTLVSISIPGGTAEILVQGFTPAQLADQMFFL